MNKTKIAVLSLFAALALSVSAFGQTALTATKLAAAVTTSANIVRVSSATGILAGNLLFIEDGTGGGSGAGSSEAMLVESISGTVATVVRGYYGSIANAHISGALVITGTPNQFYCGRTFRGLHCHGPAGHAVHQREKRKPVAVLFGHGLVGARVFQHCSASRNHYGRRFGCRRYEPLGSAVSHHRRNWRSRPGDPRPRSVWPPAEVRRPTLSVRTSASSRTAPSPPPRRTTSRWRQRR
jgi:hypothetical protein